MKRHHAAPPPSGGSPDSPPPGWAAGDVMPGWSGGLGSWPPRRETASCPGASAVPTTPRRERRRWASLEHTRGNRFWTRVRLPSSPPQARISRLPEPSDTRGGPLYGLVAQNTERRPAEVEVAGGIPAGVARHRGAGLRPGQSRSRPSDAGRSHCEERRGCGVEGPVSYPTDACVAQMEQSAALRRRRPLVRAQPCAPGPRP